MSYILDALKKSELQRQNGATPSLLTVQTTPEASTRPAFLIYGLIAAALIGAGIVIGSSHLLQQEQLSPVTDSNAVKPLEPELRTPLTMTRQGIPSTKTQGQTRKLPPKTAAAIPTQKTTPIHEMTDAPTLTKAIAPPQEKFTDTVSTSTPQEQKVITMGELPLAILREVPVVSIQVHAYSSVANERIVGINDRLLQEGEYVAPGLKLEQITPDGIIFSYKNYLFRRGL